MAVDHDEFDVEIENTAFDIEDDDIIGTGTGSWSHDEGNAQAENENESNFQEKKSLLVTPKEQQEQRALSNDTSESQPECSILDVSSQMDDGFDDLLSQIDENEVSLSSREVVLKPVNGNDADASTNQFADSSESFRSRRKNSPNESSHFFSTQDNSSGHPPIKRRFPGPAGLLPDIQRGDLKFINMSPHPLYQKVSKLVSDGLESSSNVYAQIRKNPVQENSGICSNEVLINKAPWKSLMKTLSFSNEEERDLRSIYNLKWIRMKATRFPEDMKIPFLAAVVQGDLELISSKNKFRHKNPSVKLMDPSGSIVAAFNPSFVEAYGSKIVPGTALALRNCGVFKFEKHIVLTVAKKNLLCLATTIEILEDEWQTELKCKEPIPNLQVDNGIFVLQVAPLLINEILQEYKNISTKLDTKQYNLQVLNEFSCQNKSDSTETSLPQHLFSSVSAVRRIEPYKEPFLQQNLANESPDSTNSNCNQQNKKVVANFPADNASGFDDDDDEELLQALEYIDFVIDEDSM